jgi:hypothetical protein
MDTILSGSYTSDGASRTIYVPSCTDCFEWFVRGAANGDNWDSVANPGVIKRGWWFTGMDQGTALTVYNTAGAATDQSTFVAADGVTIIDPDNPITYAGTAVTGLTQASPSVITSAAHGLVTGDLVRLTNVTGAQQASSIVYTATRVNANTFSVPLVAAAWAAAGTGGLARKVNKESFDPKRLTITGITAANPAVITVSTTHAYNVGSKVRLIVPTAFGMTEMNNLIGEVTAIGANTITVDIDSSAFTAFAYPTSAIAAAGVTWPQVVPVGEEYDILTDRIRNTDVRGVNLGATVVGATSALVVWRAVKSQGYNVTAD